MLLAFLKTLLDIFFIILGFMISLMNFLIFYFFLCSIISLENVVFLTEVVKGFWFLFHNLSVNIVLFLLFVIKQIFSLLITSKYVFVNFKVLLVALEDLLKQILPNIFFFYKIFELGKLHRKILILFPHF